MKIDVLGRKPCREDVSWLGDLEDPGVEDDVVSHVGVGLGDASVDHLVVGSLIRMESRWR